MRIDEAWSNWWQGLGHVARCNRDPARTREAFEAGYLAAVEEAADPKRKPFNRNKTARGFGEEAAMTTRYV